jgi:hypothetical protein
MNMERLGNTSAASIPILLDEMHEMERSGAERSCSLQALAEDLPLVVCSLGSAGGQNMKYLNEILDIKYPVIQGGMANIATGAFAAACSQAGALGMIATGGIREAEMLREEIRTARS